MKDIKTKSTVKDIKAFDKTSDLSSRMKDAYIRTKEHAEPMHQPESGSYVDQATDSVKESASSIVPKGGRALKDQGQRAFQKFRERGKSDRDAERFNSSGSEGTHRGPESEAQRTGREAAREQAKQGLERKPAESQTTEKIVQARGKTVQQAAKTTARTDKTIKQSARGTVKTLQKSVKSTESAAKTTIKTSQATAKAAVQAAKTSQRAAQAARISARVAAATARNTAKAVVAAVKAAIAAVKSIVSLIAAGGWVAVVIILIIMLAAMLICSPFGVFLNGGGNDTPTLSSAIQTINNEFDQKIAGIEAQAGPVDKVVFVPAHPDPNKSHVTNWPDIVAVWSVRTSMGNDATDVVEMDDGKINKLRQVFQDMVSVTSAVTEEPDDSASSSSGVSSGQPSQSSPQSQSTSSGQPVQSGSQPQGTSSSQTGEQKVLTITITEKAYQDMTAEYALSSDQAEALSELMSADNKEQMESIVDAALS